LDELDLMWMPIYNAWRLHERYDGALVTYLDNRSDEAQAIRNYYLGDPKSVKNAMQAVANQGEAK
jgi:hypothetical protein